MGDVLICHPVSGGEVLVPAEAMWHYRQAGWITVAERQQNEQEAQAREARAAEQEQPARQEPPVPIRKGAAAPAAD